MDTSGNGSGSVEQDTCVRTGNIAFEKSNEERGRRSKGLQKRSNGMT